MRSLLACALLPRLAGALGALSALRARGPESAEALKTLDRNSDGRVTFDEIASFAKAKGLDYASTLTEFSGFDANQDGQLDPVELTKALGPPAAAGPLLATGAPSRPARSGGLALADAARRTVTGGAGLSQLSESSEVERRAATLSERANLMQAEAQKELGAQELDRQAALLRANATAILRRAQQDASESGMLAARAKAEELHSSLVKLQGDAMRAEVRAAAVKAKAEAELTEANDLMFVAESGLSTVGRA
ncbi:unnamed protein product [Prorocentrum cordatum]|uniref:EF-hand domain-containing protein n=1 Tax=Prorocentrum cordatum TaxID=2364126 RepID=A0ABN9SIX2_9DINO|nr:unnamed protein product [Polarella glacialis]